MAGNIDNSEENMEQVSLYYDHYKDTYEQQKKYIAKRDRLTLYLLVLAIILIGLLFDPLTFGEKVNIIMGAYVENLTFDLYFINTGLLLVTLWCLIQYYMVVLQIEKMYRYIAECEKRLTDAIPVFPINREGAYYLKSYPWLKNIADYIFVLGIPIGFVLLCISKMMNEYTWDTNLRYIDFVIQCLIIIFSLLYISNRKLHEEYWNETLYSISWYQRLAGYVGIKKYQENTNSQYQQTNEEERS